MRSVQDRVMLILNHLNAELISTLFADESLAFLKGSLYYVRSHDDVQKAASFAFSEYSFPSPLHSIMGISHNFRQALSTIENDETKILQIYLTDRQCVLVTPKHSVACYNTLLDINRPLYKKLFELGTTDGWRVHVISEFEEFGGIVTEFYKLIFNFGQNRTFHFKATQFDLITDACFLSSVVDFASVAFKHEISLADLEHDFYSTIEKFPVMLGKDEYLESELAFYS